MKNNTTQTERCIYVTKDYDSIKHISGNRAINPNNVEKIKQSMSEKQLIVAAVVNENMEIIDGQHRHEACRQLGLPFYYYIVDGYQLADVQRMNTNMKNWTLNDFMDTYLDLYKLGHHEYKGYMELKVFMQDYGLSLQTALALANTKIGKHAYEETFKTGNFIFRDKNIAGLIASEMNEVFQGFDEKIWKALTFVNQYVQLYFYEDYDLSLMLKRGQTLAVGTKNSPAFHNLKTGHVILNGLVEAYNHRTPHHQKINVSEIEYAFTNEYQKGK